MNSILNFLVYIIDKFTSSKQVKIGTFFVSSGIMLMAGSAYSFMYIKTGDTNQIFSFNISDDTGLFAFVLGVLNFLIGVYILIKSYIKLDSQEVPIYFGNLLKKGDSLFPIYAMDKDDRVNAKKIKLKIIDSYNKEAVFKEFQILERLFEDRTEHKEVHKIYVAALASTPYLFLLGTMLRNGHIQNEILDYYRDADKWYKLNSFGDKLRNTLMYEDTNMSVDERITELCNSDSDSVAIALSYTFQIHKNSIPPELLEHTIFLTHGLGFGNDKIDNKMSQISLLNEIAVFIDKLKSVNKEVHLFISAQASFNIRFGKRYQDNTMGTLYVYNYDGDSRSYNWNISFDGSKIQ